MYIKNSLLSYKIVLISFKDTKFFTQNKQKLRTITFKVIYSLKNFFKNV